MNKNIKKLTMLLFVAATTLAVASCSKDDDNNGGGGGSTPTEEPTPDPPPGPAPDPTSDGFDANGASAALFSISSWDLVRFSKGNLQYNASTDTWRFAEKQTDHIGAENNKIADDNTNWIDLFGYGTSGWESGAEAYQPWSTASSYSKYLNQDLADAYEEADWGAHNAIANGGNRAGMWRTLTKDEWSFLLNSRNASTVGGAANGRFAKATVSGVKGLILFPDEYEHPDGVEQPSSVNDGGASFSANSYAPSHFSKMQSAGAIFLPITGYRSGYQILERDNYGHYWSASATSSYSSYALTFNPLNLTVTDIDRSGGRAVRLVMDAE